MSERTIPTLEEIAAGEGHRFDRRTIEAELAAVLIAHNRRLGALSSRVDALNEQVGALLDGAHLLNTLQDADRRDIDRWGDRIRALEQQARPYQEDGHLAVGLGCEACDYKGMSNHLLRQKLETAERERDRLIEREHELVCQREDLRQALADEISKADAARADVERLRDLLEQYAAVDEGLGLHLPNCRKHVYDRRSSPCTCGLADALKEAPDA